MFQNQLLHGEATANDVADINSNAQLSQQQQMAQEALLRHQEKKQAKLLLDQYGERKEIENELKREEQAARHQLEDNIDDQKLMVGCQFLFMLCGSSRSQMLFEIIALKNFSNFTGKHLC